MTYLLDGNVLVALCTAEHVHHQAAAQWLAGGEQPFATTPITQGTVLRFLIREGVPAANAVGVVEGVTRHARHVFWRDEVPYSRGVLKGVIGHRQVTDAYLATLARHHGGRLVTLDRGLAALHDDVAELIAV